KPAQPHPPQASPNDQLNNYLEAARLTTLLAENLNVELRAAAGASRAPIARTLARVYAELLESTTDPDRTRAIEQRASALLADVPEADSIDLRLTLARSAYTIAELQAEKWRLRINARAEADTARRAFTDLERRFADLATAAEKRIDSLEKQEEQTSGSGADRRLLSSALASTRRTRSMAHFLAGWSAYYIAELDPPAAPDAVNRAERHFGWILNARAGAAPTTDRVPTQLLTYEHVARACLGVALCQSIRGTEEAALRWTRLVETTPGVPASVARQITARKLIILARTRNWPAVAAVVDPRGGGATTSTLSPIDARLLAVLALEARQAGETSATLTPLIVLALEALAGQGELDQIVELASRYFDRAEDLAPGGFLPAYIRGLREYDRATRERNAAGEPDHRPVTNPEIRRTYTTAARFLNDALASKDADQFTTALPGVTLLHAFSRFYSAQSPADLQDAAALFTRAAALHDPRNSPEAPRARLLAIRALDAALRQSRTPEAAAQRQALIDDFLKRHPTHPAAANVLYERALSEGASPREAAADLLTIPDDSPLALPAHHQAARLLYERFLAAPTESRTTAAAEFLAVAEPLLDRSRRAQQPDTDEATALMLTTARRVVDCLIKLPEPDPRRVRRAFDTVESTIARGIAVPAALHAEVEYRSVQIALLENDWPAAEAALARLRDTDTSLADSAERAIYQHAADRFNQETTDSPARVTLARTLFRFGRDVINHLPERDSNPANPAVATLYYNVARAASAIFAETRETDARDAAASYFSSLISAYPTDANFLRAAAAHSQLAGDTDAALAAWRGLLAGLPQGAPEWFDAKCRVIDLLIATDRDAARAALQQHRILYPDLGPEPWRTRLLEQERRLASDQPEPAP
ncbi:MAG: hypothetical protein JNK58_10900, partial [Phycisphaerae bacterium]|nr:hypothetical protein [Phycisphaerae bacterium]